jgi:hypothetical protein
MIDALIAGKLYGTVSVRTAKNGNRFATAKVRVTTATGEPLFVNVIALAAPAVEALLAPTRTARRGRPLTSSRMPRSPLITSVANAKR